MSELPTQVHIVEEGPREGFQSEPAGIATAQKVELIEALADCGVPEIDCASFVSPKAAPQMADALDISTQLTLREDVLYSCMWLNEKGFINAQQSRFHLPALTSGSASDTFLSKNNRRTPEEQVDTQRLLRKLYSENGIGSGPVYLFTAFGCNYEGEIAVDKAMLRASELIAICEENGTPPSSIYLCDTVGAADPLRVRNLVDAVRTRWPDYPVALHLHDTRGLGIANAMAGLELGVARFDCSVGGMGGCPFAGNKAAAGNIATEELVMLCERMGIETGIDLAKLIDTAVLAERIVGHNLPGKLFKSGLFNS